MAKKRRQGPSAAQLAARERGRAAAAQRTAAAERQGVIEDLEAIRAEMDFLERRREHLFRERDRTVDEGRELGLTWAAMAAAARTSHVALMRRSSVRNTP